MTLVVCVASYRRRTMEQKIATLNCVAINQQQTEMNSSTDNDGLGHL